jgi:HAD superfamily hydrolase (TIGR01509 family)
VPEPLRAAALPTDLPAHLPTGLPAAVLWDMDGTLVDTEPYWIRAEHELVAAHGGRWSHEKALRLVGNDLLTSGRIIRDEGPVDLAPEEIVDRLLERVVELVRERVPWQPGGRELLTALSGAGVPCALVTMSYEVFAAEVVSRGPADAFRTMVTGDQVARGKPHPDPYLVAAERLGVDPRACVAIEDSPTGITAALASGARTLGVEAVLPLPHLAGLSRASSLTQVDLSMIARIAGGEVLDLTA